MIALLSFFLILFASPFQVEEPTESASVISRPSRRS